MDVSMKGKLKDSTDSKKKKDKEKSEVKKAKTKKSKITPKENVTEENANGKTIDKKESDVVSTVQDKRKEQKIKDRKAVFRYVAPVLVVFLIMMFCDAVCDSMNAQSRAKIEEQTKTYDSTNNKITVANNQYKDLTQQEKVQANLHYYTGDTSADDSIANEFFSKFCTWSNGSEYNALRDEALALGYDENSSFMKCFFPAQMTVTDSAYNTYYAIDTYGVNLKFNDLKTVPMSYNGSTCMQSYSAIVTVSSDITDERGVKSTNVSKCYVTYSITSEGKITNIEAALLAN